MIPVMIVFVFVLIFFVAFVAYIAKLLIKVTKKERPTKPLIAKAIASGAIWAILGCVNVVLFIAAMSRGDPLIDKLLSAGADATSKVLVYTFEGIEKNWNKDTLAKADMIGFKIVSVKKAEAKDADKDKVRYDLNLLLENRLEKGKPISYWDLTSQNLLFALDGNDVFYPVKIADQTPEVIPLGKSYLSISILLPKFAELKQVGLGENKLGVDR
jgi:hypothetical protein